MLHSLETYAQMGERAGRAARQHDHARSDVEFKAASRAISIEAPEDQAAAREAFNVAYLRAAASPGMEYFK